MRTLDRSKPFATRCGPIADRIRYIQDGVNFDEMGREVFPSALPPVPAGDPDPDIIPARPVMGSPPPEVPAKRGPGRPPKHPPAA